MGSDEFPFLQPQHGCFIVLNTAPQVKTIKIFNYPINYMCTRNLLLIPGVGEGDIRSSLLKGELNYKIRCADIIVVCSDIDLLQFNSQQKSFLQGAGIVNGLQVGANNLSVLRKEDISLIGSIDGVNVLFKIPNGFYIQNSVYKIIIYKNGVKQVLGDDYFVTESGGPGTGFDSVIFAIPPVNIPTPSDVITADYYQDNSLNSY